MIASVLPVHLEGCCLCQEIILFWAALMLLLKGLQFLTRISADIKVDYHLKGTIGEQRTVTRKRTLRVTPQKVMQCRSALRGLTHRRLLLGSSWLVLRVGSPPRDEMNNIRTREHFGVLLVIRSLYWHLSILFLSHEWIKPKLWIYIVDVPQWLCENAAGISHQLYNIKTLLVVVQG